MWDSARLLCNLPPPLQTVLRQAPPELIKEMTELRLRAGLPLAVTAGGRTLYLSSEGVAVPAGHGFIIPQGLIQETMLSLCGHSFHGIEKTLEQGFFTAHGGFRVGVCLQPYAARQGMAQSLCIRLPREVLGAAEEVYSLWQQSGGLILAGPPASGKTTVLRDLCRLISDGAQGGAPSRVVLIDERCELSGWDGEKCAFHLGSSTDILSGIPKAKAVIQAIRTLSPQVILCDEIADEQEVSAIRSAFFGGAQFAVTVHCGSEEEIFKNGILQGLMQSGVFRHLYLLGVPAGRAKGVVICRDEFVSKTAGGSVGNGRFGGNGFCVGSTTAFPTPDGGSNGAILGGLSAADGIDRPATGNDCGKVGTECFLPGDAVCAETCNAAGERLLPQAAECTGRDRPDRNCAKGNAALDRSVGALADGSGKADHIGGAGGTATGGKIPGRTRGAAGGALQETGGAGGTGAGGFAHLTEETAWKWISSSE